MTNDTIQQQNTELLSAARKHCHNTSRLGGAQSFGPHQAGPTSAGSAVSKLKIRLDTKTGKRVVRERHPQHPAMRVRLQPNFETVLAAVPQKNMQARATPAAVPSTNMQVEPLPYELMTKTQKRNERRRRIRAKAADLRSRSPSSQTTSIELRFEGEKPMMIGRIVTRTTVKEQTGSTKA